MRFESHRRTGVANSLFAVVVVVLVVVAAAGLLLATRSTQTVTVTSTSSMTEMSTSESMSSTGTQAIAFTAAHGQMFGSGWLLVASIGGGDYAVSVHATGLEGASMGDYIVEAVQSSGQMATVPIAGTNDTLSEFEADSTGTGNYFTTLMENPSSAFESVAIVYLPSMEMQNATTVATASLSM